MNIEEKNIKERNALKMVIELGDKIINSLIGRNLFYEELYMCCSLIHILKQAKAIIILYDNGCYESGQAILRNIYEITFKTVALLKNKKLLENYIEKFHKEKIKLLNYIERENFYEYISKEKIEKYLAESKNNLKNIDIYDIGTLARKANLAKEYINYKYLCGYTHLDIGVIESIISESSEGIFLNPNPIYPNIHEEYAILIGILEVSIKEILENINNEDLKKEYNVISDICNEIW